MSWMDDLAMVQEQIMSAINRRLTSLFDWTITSRTTSMGSKEAAQLSDEFPSRSRPNQRLEHFGFRSRGVPGRLRGFRIVLGSSNVIEIGLVPSEAFGPIDLDEGESCQYCQSAEAQVKLDKNGKVLVTASPGQDVTVNVSAGGKVLLAGGGPAVGRVGDAVKVNIPSGTAVGGWGISTTPLDIDGTITAGSAVVKAG